ncbi:MAG: RHS repeat-associated core domain-containing protein [Phycisphaerales bacterium]|nr:RHS repeat-associated core domain-containing protein [Phycisphaerales bacterium]
MTVRPVAGTEAAGLSRVEFGYDAGWRRVRKTVTPWDEQTSNWASAPSLDRKYLWSGWRLLLETDVLASGGEAVLRSFTWGLDLAGLGGAVNSLESAGTIGGLLAVRKYDVNGGPEPDDPVDYVYVYDAMGNVAQVVDWSRPASQAGAAVVAHYEYDPYGGVTKAEGGYAADNAWRFSTKQWDNETGLGYWGKRYYSPSLGRWASWDPASEIGFSLAQHALPASDRAPTADLPELNTYAYVLNGPTRAIDALGLNLYAVDGTWSGQPWSAKGTNTWWIYNLAREVKQYWHGPYIGITGSDARAIAKDVLNRICSDQRAAYAKCEEQPLVNLVGWSRGGAIVTYVTHRLADDGCCVSRAWWGKCNVRIRPWVNWLGLFDAVDMAPAIPNWAMTAPTRVDRISHAVKTTTSVSEWSMFPTAPIDPQTFFWRKDGTGTTHRDIGTNMFNNDAFFWMLAEARQIGVEL